MDGTDTHTGPHGFQLPDRARTLEAHRNAPAKLGHVVERGRTVEFLDVSHDRVIREVIATLRRRTAFQGIRGCEKADVVVGEFSVHEPSGFGFLKDDGDVDLAPPQGIDLRAP